MRVLIVNKSARVTGGADVHSLGLAGALIERGHRVAMLSTASPENLFGDGEFVDASVTHVSRGHLGVRERLDVARRALWNPGAADAMRTLIRGFRPQVVHSHKLYPQLSVAPIVVARRAGLPIVQTLHDYEFISASWLDHRGRWIDHDESRRSARALNEATLLVRRGLHTRAVDAWIANSRYVAARHRARGIEATALPLFIEPAGVDPLPFADRHGAVFVGRLDAEKGVPDVIRVAELVPSLELTVAGHGPLEEEVTEAAGRLSNLTFAGRLPHSEVLELLGRAQVCLMPSRWQEPAGLAALEAMSVGTPVIAYASGGLVEYVEDAGGGQVIEPDANALARECEALPGDRERWERLSAAGIAGVAANNSPEAYAVAVEGIYERVVAARARVDGAG
jgi:glycosyltransferase involved in cell wall biosynthesis